MTETSVAFNDGSALVKCHSYCKSWQCGSWAAWTTAEPWSCSSSVELSHHSFSCLCLCFFFWHVKMSSVEKVCVALRPYYTTFTHFTDIFCDFIVSACRKAWLKVFILPCPSNKTCLYIQAPFIQSLHSKNSPTIFRCRGFTLNSHLKLFVFFYWKTAWHLLKIQQMLLKKRTSEEAISAIISSSLSFSPRSPVSRNPDNRSQAVKKITSMIYNIADMFGCMRQKTCTVAYLGHSHQRVHPYMLSVS